MQQEPLVVWPLGSKFSKDVPLESYISVGVSMHLYYDRQDTLTAFRALRRDDDEDGEGTYDDV